MLKFRLIRAALDVWVDTNNPHESVPIQFKSLTQSDNSFLKTVPSILKSQYGAFGHLIGSETTPIDLHSAMQKPEMQAFKPVLVEGTELVERDDPDIPKNAIT